jgi:hypothetical protein
MYKINCNNATCELRDACSNFNNKNGEKKYCRPMITFDNFGLRIFRCDNLFPYNMDILVKESKINNNAKKVSSKLKLKYKIVDKFGGENKPGLMKMINELE